MASFITFLCLLQCVFSNGTSFKTNPIHAPKIVVILSMQRSGSTSLNTMLASHPCALNGNEIMTDRESQDLLLAHKLTGMDWEYTRSNPLEFLMESHRHICGTRSECGGDCTIFVKLFDINGISDENLLDLFSSQEIGYVVLERNPADSYSSMKNAEEQGDWLTSPGENRPKKINYELTEKYRKRQSDWYVKLRGFLRDVGHTYVEVSFQSIQSCDLIHEVLPRVYNFFGMESGMVVNVDDDNFLESSMEEFIKKCV